MLLKKVDLLESQNRQFRVLMLNYEQQDSLKNNLIEVNKELYESAIYKLNANLKKETRKRKLNQLGLYGTIVVALAALLIVK
jgi:formyltetrahydrofolate synthetase